MSAAARGQSTRDRPLPGDSPQAAVSDPTELPGRRLHFLRELALRQETTLIMVIVVIGAATAVRNPTFLTLDNVQQILQASVGYLVIGCGLTFLVLGGGLDFSIGSVYTLVALVGCKAMASGVPVPLAMLAGLCVGAGIGAVNHALITYLRVPPIIATLGTFFIAGGVDNLLTGGQDVVPLPSSFTVLGHSALFGVSAVIWYAAVCAVGFWYVLQHTRLGVNIRALGGNRQAAIGNGLRVVRLDLLLYVLAGVTAGLAGLIYSAQVGAGQVEGGGASLTLGAVTAVLIGGVSIFGGLGSITGVAVGAVLLAEIDNALVLADISPQYNNIIVGTVLILAVAIDFLRRRRLYRGR